MYCPEGSAAPLYVDAGYYSINTGFVTDFSASRDASNLLPSLLPQAAGTRASQEICPKGYYCKDAEVFPCPVGRYSDVLGMADPQCSGPCDPGASRYLKQPD